MMRWWCENSISLNVFGKLEKGVLYHIFVSNNGDGVSLAVDGVVVLPHQQIFGRIIINIKHCRL